MGLEMTHPDLSAPNCSVSSSPQRDYRKPFRTQY
jgi:hypothetical protein